MWRTVPRGCTASTSGNTGVWRRPASISNSKTTVNGDRQTMKAVIHTAYGSPDQVLEVREIDMPAVGENDVLVRVRAASMHADVWHVVTGLPYVLRLMGNGLSKPKKLVPGMDLAGIVERVGGNVTRFKPGDEVFGGTGVMRGW